MTRFALALSMLTPLGAQWLTQKWTGVPRTADGKPNLSAPAPRTADGKVDFTGLWNKISPKYNRDIVADFKPDEIPDWVKKLVAERTEDLFKDYMTVYCLPLGPGYITTEGTTAGGMTKIIQAPTELVFLNPDMTYRQIFVDGRKLEANPNPSWMGYSAGHWEGDTLVVESNGYNDRSWLDRDGHPHSDALRITERYKRPDFGHLDIEVTLQDPKIYSKTWTVNVKALLTPDTELLEYVCAEEKVTTQHWVGKASDDIKNEFKIDPAVLAKYVGNYKELDIWNAGPVPRVIEITTEGGALYAELKGRDKVRLVAQTQTTFSGFNGLGIGFLVDAQGNVTHLIEMHVSGNYRFTKQ